MIDRSRHSPRELLLTLVRASRRYPVLVLNGSVGLRGRYVDLAAAAVATRRRRPPLVVLSECAWKQKTGAERLIRRLSIRAIDNRRIVYCVLSTFEREQLPRAWKIDRDRVVFTPFCHNLAEEEVAEANVERDGTVFAGGNALRDYGPLIEAARSLPTVPVRIATDTLASDGLPANVEVLRTSHDAFMDALRRASVVVVPFRAGLERAAGLLTYLSAMALGKLVVVTEGPGVRDHIDDGETGIVIPPADARALSDTVRWALDPANDDAVTRIAAQAAEAGRTRFSPDNYVAELLRVVDRFS